MQVDILNPAKKVVQTKAISLEVPGKLGYMTILPKHAELISELDVGSMRLTTDNGKELDFFVSGGYVVVANDDIKVLADVIEPIKDIDVERAKKAKERALARLEKAHKEPVDHFRALRSLKRAELRIALFKMIKM
ncbi:MAG: ATP synthase F1 subunit epsilon [Oligoflexales bacterium]